MDGEIYPRKFPNPPPSNILFEDMLENDQPNNDNRLEECIICLPPMDDAPGNS